MNLKQIERISNEYGVIGKRSAHDLIAKLREAIEIITVVRDALEDMDWNISRYEVLNDFLTSVTDEEVKP
jgi:hypothetical protein